MGGIQRVRLTCADYRLLPEDGLRHETLQGIEFTPESVFQDL